MTSDNVSRAARLIALMEPDELEAITKAVTARKSALESQDRPVEPEHLAKQPKPTATTKTAKGKRS